MRRRWFGAGFRLVCLLWMMPLMKFLIYALRSYHSEAIREMTSSAGERRALLAGCFGLDVGKHGGNTRRREWSTAKKQELHHMFAATQAGLGDQQSCRKRWTDQRLHQKRRALS